MSLIKCVALTFAFISLLPIQAAEDTPLAPFHAQYKVLRNGNAIGQASMDLTKQDNGTWKFVSATKGTEGLAKVLGVDVTETSQFRWRNKLPEGLRYDYAQDTAIKSRQRQINFDWGTNKASVTEGKETHSYALQPGAMDRHSVTLALAVQLQQGIKNFDLHVTVKDRLEMQHYETVKTTESIETPAGKFTAQRIERQGKEHPVHAWFALARYPIPVQIEQMDGKDNTVTLQLVSFKKN